MTIPLNKSRQTKSEKINAFGLRLFVCAIYLMFLVSGTAVAEESIGKLPVLSDAFVHTIENTSFCHVGFGSQVVEFQMDGEYLHSEKHQSIYLPSVNMYDFPFIGLGCSVSKIVVFYSYYQNSIKFHKDIELGGVSYNVIDFTTHSLSAGYSFSLVPHYLYLDTGVGYTQTQYTMDYISGGQLRKDESIDSRSGGIFGFSTIKWFVTAFLFLDFQYQMGFTNETISAFTNHLGINFLVKL